MLALLWASSFQSLEPRCLEMELEVGIEDGLEAAAILLLAGGDGRAGTYVFTQKIWSCLLSSTVNLSMKEQGTKKLQYVIHNCQ